MMRYEIRETADRVRAVPLPAVLALAGAERDRTDRAKWHTAQGALSVTGMKFMNWNRGVGGGGAIDLVMHIEDLGFRAAVEWLARRFPTSESAGRTQSPSPRRGLELPPRDTGKLSLVRRYLVQERHLGPSLIEPLLETGKIYADPRGNAVFLLLGEGSRPVGAELRGTTRRAWRGMAPGSRKNLGYFSVSAPRAERIVLCESAIDALGCFTLFPESLCISTAGARPNPRWLTPLIRSGYEICCGFDADPTGDNMAQAMISFHPTVKRLRPPLHDCNDVLKSQS